MVERHGSSAEVVDELGVEVMMEIWIWSVPSFEVSTSRKRFKIYKELAFLRKKQKDFSKFQRAEISASFDIP